MTRHAHGNDHRIPQPVIDIAGRGDHGEGDGRQEAAEPAVADMVGQGHRGVADAGREQLDQQRRDRPVDHRHIEHEQEQDGDDQRLVRSAPGRPWRDSRPRSSAAFGRRLDSVARSPTVDRARRRCVTTRVGCRAVPSRWRRRRPPWRGRTWRCRSRSCRTWSCRSDRTGTSSRRDRRSTVTGALACAAASAGLAASVSASNSGK